MNAHIKRIVRFSLGVDGLSWEQMSPSIGNDIFLTQEATLVGWEAKPRHLRRRILLYMRVTYDVETDAAYVYLTDEVLPPGRDSVPCDPPEGVQEE